MSTLPNGAGGFVSFYRRYTKTWLHALTTAALTAFGILAIIHRGFIALAVGAYVLPPIVLYLRQSRDTDETEDFLETVDAASTGPPQTTESEQDTEPSRDSIPEAEWTTTDSPTESTLFDVTVAESAAYAVGADGVVIADTGAKWQIMLTDGPGAAAQTLRGVDSTVDGDVVWIAGDGGSVARLDAETGRHVDFSAPNGQTDTWEDIAVSGSADQERVLLVNGSGEVVRGQYHDGDLDWDEPIKPGSGSSLSGVILVAESVGYACDTNDGVFETTDGGKTFRRIGIEQAEGTLTDVASTARGDCIVTADDGVLHRHDAGTWTPVRLSDEPLAAIAVHDGHGVVCGGTAVYERAAGTVDWDRAVTVEDESLLGVSVGSERVVAVGDDGTLVERMVVSTRC